MNKKNFQKTTARVVLFLAAVVLLVFAYEANERYKEKHGIDTTSGATELAE